MTFRHLQMYERTVPCEGGCTKARSSAPTSGEFSLTLLGYPAGVWCKDCKDTIERIFGEVRAVVGSEASQ